MAQLDEKAKAKPQGYREDVLAAATREGDTIDLPQDAYERLALKWRIPGLAEMMGNVAKAALAFAANPEIRTSDEVTAALTTCVKCPFLVEAGFRCGKCGCFLEAKAWAKAWKCPDNRWA